MYGNRLKLNYYILHVSLCRQFGGNYKYLFIQKLTPVNIYSLSLIKNFYLFYQIKIY